MSISYEMVGLRWLTQASLVAQMIKNLPAVWETQVRSLCWENPLGKGMATHASILAWTVPWKARSDQSIFKKINLESSLEDLMLKLQYFSHLMQTVKSLKKCLMLGKIERVKEKSLIRVQLFTTPWTVAYQAPPSMGFSRQEYWSG